MNERDIKQAFDNVNPSSEAENRMLANILAAADAARQNETEQPQESNVIDFPPPTVPSAANNLKDYPPPVASPQKRRSPWKIALPIAASVVLVLGVGFAVLNTASPLQIFDKVFTQSAPESTSGGAPESTPESAYSSAEEAEANNAAEQPLGDALPPSASPETQEPLANNDTAMKYLRAPELRFMPAASEYFTIELSDGRRSTLLGNANPWISLAEPNLVGKELYVAKAYNPDFTFSVPCFLYEYYSSDEQYYAVKYPGEYNYYLCIAPAS